MTTSRREVMAAALALGASRAIAASDVDVAIVGAGAAGLAAARRVQRSERSVIVLEGRARLGGRAFTDASLGVPFDAGAHYIHWAERNPWKAIAAELHVPVEEEDDGGGRFLVFQNGAELSPAARMLRRRGFNRASDMLALRGRADLSFQDAVRGEPEEVASAAAAITRLSLGEEPERVSVGDYEQLWSGEDDVVPSGYGALVERYGAGLPVRLSTPVERIRWGGTGVEIVTQGGVVRARTAIVTASIGVLKAGGIRFEPDLPADMQDALGGLAMGAYTKIALKLDRTRLAGLDGADFIDLGADGAMTSVELFPFGRDLAIAYLGGDQARALCAAGESAAVDFATERLSALAGGRFRDAVTGGRLAGWWTDPFARGGYSIVLPGHVGAREKLRLPVGNRIWLAGEAGAGGGAMTVGGAFLEGERAAGEAVASLTRG